MLPILRPLALPVVLVALVALVALISGLGCESAHQKAVAAAIGQAELQALLTDVPQQVVYVDEDGSRVAMVFQPPPPGSALEAVATTRTPPAPGSARQTVDPVVTPLPPLVTPLPPLVTPLPPLVTPLPPPASHP